MNSIIVRSSANRTSFNITIGCLEGWSRKRLWKYDEQAERTTWNAIGCATNTQQKQYNKIITHFFFQNFIDASKLENEFLSIEIAVVKKND